MATIIKRGKTYYVVYAYRTEDGEIKQKWESFRSMADARLRQKDIEFRKENKTFSVSVCRTMNELLDEYIELHGKNHWAMSTYSRCVSAIDNYIRPALGDKRVTEITTRHLEAFYQNLLKTKAVRAKCQKGSSVYVGTGAIREIHKILRNCFNEAVKWEIIEKNPAIYATVPKHKPQKRDIWPAETLFRAIELCDDEGLKLSLHLAFACSLRSGELLGLTWDCVDISEEAMRQGTPSIFIKKELQRVSKEAFESIEKNEVLHIFKESSSRTKSYLVLKTPKTESSIRKVFLPVTLAEMLIEHKKKQAEEKELLGSEYQDNNLVICSAFGTPREQTSIEAALQRLIKEHNLPKIVFHSIRHASITYKLKLNGGDVKAVQGDSGHSQSSMVTDVYSHILDEGRKVNAELFEEEFYSGKGKTKKREPKQEPEQQSDVKTIMKLLGNPESAALLKQLIAAMENIKE